VIHVPRAVVVTFVVAVAVRLATALCVPLVITNDGAGYLSWALDLRDGVAVDWPPFRTPGYSGFLAGLIAVFGESAAAIQVVQHGLGVVTAVLVAVIAGRWVRPRLSAALGCLAALDPVLLGFECYALTEALSAVLLMVSVWLACGTRHAVLRGCVLGAALAALCLVRPAFQVIVPFLGLALCVAPGLTRGERCGAACAMVLAAGLALMPWVVRSARQGTYGLSGAKSVYLWIGMHQSGLLAAPAPEPLREAYTKWASDPADDAGMHRFLGSRRAWESAEVQAALREWTWRSLRESPGGYAAAAARAGLWQLDVFVPGGPMPHNETRWLVRRVGRDGRDAGMPAANVQYAFSPRDVGAFWSDRGPGWFGAYFRAWARNQPALPVRVVLLGFAVCGVVLAVRARRYAVALVLAGTLAYWGIHAATLLYNSRYSLPCWAVWWVAPAVAIGCWRARRVGPPSLAKLPPPPGRGRMRKRVRSHDEAG
jgi:hypothetical protein